MTRGHADANSLYIALECWSSTNTLRYWESLREIGNQSAQTSQ